MSNMKKILFTLSAIVCSMLASAQSAYVLPSPTGADEPVTIYIDVSQTNGGLKTILMNHPDQVNNVYLWTWMPADNGGNGSWSESNQFRKMTHVSGMLFSFDTIPTIFYGVDGPTFFANGISCLAKLRDGNAFADDGAGEAKTEDLKITIIPKLCDDLYCTFPELSKPEDFISITYNNNIETNPDLQNLSDGEVYLYILAKGTGPFNLYPYVPVAQAASTEALRMKPVPGKPGEFRLTIIPTMFFTNVPSTQTITELRYYVVKPGYIPTQPVSITYGFLDCSN
jgi:hypothetical protein